jgi:hypothetical protein
LAFRALGKALDHVREVPQARLALNEVALEPAQRCPLVHGRSFRSTPWCDERAEYPAGQQQLKGYRETPRAVPAEAVVEELPSARTQQGEDVLEVGGGTRRRAERRRIEWASPQGEEKKARNTAADLEATRADVLVWQAVAGEV